MDKLKVYNLAGEAVGEKELDPSVFGVDVNPIVVQQVVVALNSNKRKPWAHTKGRSEVRGGGRKPWRQKGTGRARHGSIRSPLWKGGGVTFGPKKERNYTVGINKKMKQAALRMVLSDKNKNGRVVLVENLELPEAKTKNVVAAIKKLPVKDSKNTMFVIENGDNKFKLACRNLPTVDIINSDSLNTLDLLNTNTVVIPINALDTINKLYAKGK